MPNDEREPSEPLQGAIDAAARDRERIAERDYVDGQLDILKERLNGIDRATVVLNETVNRTPTVVQVAIGNVRELMEEKFDSIALQFKERDTRSERESRDNKIAVDAAFAAQKEIAAQQNQSNTLAISKSETATAETISKLAELVKSQTDALADKIDANKERLAAIEAQRMGVNDERNRSRSTTNSMYLLASVIVSVVALAVAILIASRP
jgi:hypothetical protein